MKDKWLTDLKNKIDHYEATPPTGLWDDIEKELFGEEESTLPSPILPIENSTESNDTGKNTRFKSRVVMAIVSIAAGIAVLVSIIFLSGNDFSLTTENKITLNTNENTPEKGNLYRSSPIAAQHDSSPTVLSFSVKKNDLTLQKGSRAKGIYSSGRHLSKEEKDDFSVKQFTLKNTEISYPYENEINTTELLIPLQESLAANSEKDQRETLDSLYMINLHHQKMANLNKNAQKLTMTPDNKWSLGLISGQSGSNSSKQLDGYAMMNGKQFYFPSEAEAGPRDSALSEILAKNIAEDVETHIRHKLPIRLGISVFYKLNDKWGLSTGIIYSKLSSDLFSGTDINLIKSEQTIQYMGIPVQVNYMIWEKDRFSVYAAAGGQIDQSVSGKIKTEYIIDHSTKESFDEKLAVNSLQISLNAGGGMQYQVLRNFGLYAEPNLRYYFNDGSTIKTIYKEKPLQFNLEFGLRYSFR